VWPLLLFAVLTTAGVLGILAALEVLKDSRKSDALQIASSTLTAFSLVVQQVRAVWATDRHQTFANACKRAAYKCAPLDCDGLPRNVQAYAPVLALAVYLERQPLWPPFSQQFNAMARSLLPAQSDTVCWDSLSCC
jgi:hypothetical protein